MSKTTISICGEECVILPAPKGAFILFSNYHIPYFFGFIACNVNNANRVYYLDFDEDGVNYIENRNGYFNLYKDVRGYFLDKITNIAKNEKGFNERELAVSLYLSFLSHGTPMDLSAIEWFREKFKEHNITKADFDVFA